MLSVQLVPGLQPQVLFLESHWQKVFGWQYGSRFFGKNSVCAVRSTVRVRIPVALVVARHLRKAFPRAWA